MLFVESVSNDIMNFFSPFYTPTLTPDDYVQSILVQLESFLGSIYKLGASQIALFALGPVGCVLARALLPGAPVTKCYGKMNKMVKNFNIGLGKLVNAGQLPWSCL